MKTPQSELEKATRNWTLPAVMRTYEKRTEKAHWGPNLSIVPKKVVEVEEQFAEEAAILAERGYQPEMQSTEGSHLHAGRLILTGGLSIFAGRGGIRSKGKLTVTYQRVADRAVAPSASEESSDPISQIRKLAELRDAGILSIEEFEAKKADLLSRM